MVISLKHAAPLILLGALSQTAEAALPAGISGAWYNPEQSGHGVSVEILAPDRALVFWYVYDENGTPMPLYIEGDISAREISGAAYNPSGMRFGSFDPADLQLPYWGDVTLAFDDCSNATLSWRAESARFGSGSLPLVRLATISGLDCTLLPEGGAVAGGFLLDVQYRNPGINQPLHSRGYAAIDSTGAVWAVETPDDPADLIAGPTNVSLISHALAGVPVSPESEDGRLRLRHSQNLWAFQSMPAPLISNIDETLDNPAQIVLDFQSSFGAAYAFRLVPAPQPIVAPIDLDRLAGQYLQNLRGQFFNTVSYVNIDAGGGLCVDIEFNTAPGSCELSGSVTVTDGADGFFDVELTDNRDPSLGAYVGRGWLQGVADGERLVIVASNGDGMLGVIAR